MAKECVKIAREHGFSQLEDITDITDDNKWYIAGKLALIHSEVSEMLEELRVGNKQGIIKEGIDVLIRTFELLIAFEGTDIEEELYKKMTINRFREHKHGGKLI